MEDFSAVFGSLEDPRTGNAKRHLLLEMLMIALCTNVHTNTLKAFPEPEYRALIKSLP
ncbi:MAG: hypothetical protein ACT4P2_02295 [Pseudomonadota bacterium]